MSGRWQKIHDDTSGSDYYYDTVTGASQWERPAEYSEPADTTGVSAAAQEASTETSDVAADTTTSAAQTFIASATFQGSRQGYVFKKDRLGLGYYADMPMEERLAKEAEEEKEKGGLGSGQQTSDNAASGAVNGSAQAQQLDNKGAPAAVEQRGDWSKHYDENSKHYYWYNKVTGESKWVTEEPLPPMPGIDTTTVTAKADTTVTQDAASAAVTASDTAPVTAAATTDDQEATTGSVPVPKEEESKGLSNGSGIGLRSTRGETAATIASWLPAEVRNAPSIEHKNVRNVDRGYDATATFGKDSGAFDHTSGMSYWERQGKPGDKAGRQMSYYYDLDALDKNRKEAKDKKKRLQEDKSIDWKAYAQKQKKKRFLARNQWLFED